MNAAIVAPQPGAERLDHRVRHEGVELGDVVDAANFEVLGGERGDGDGRVLQPCLAELCGDHHLFERPFVAFCGDSP